jgi:hypothetical protein
MYCVLFVFLLILVFWMCAYVQDSEIPLRARLLRTMVQLRVPLYTRSFRGTSMLDYCAVRHLLEFALVLIEGAAPSAAYTASRHTGTFFFFFSHC